MEFSYFFYDPTDVGNLISGSSAFSKSSLKFWKFSVHVLLKSHVENFEHNFASMCSVQSLGWEDPLEKGTATHSSILAWRIPWTA